MNYSEGEDFMIKEDSWSLLNTTDDDEGVIYLGSEAAKQAQIEDTRLKKNMKLCLKKMVNIIFGKKL